MADAPLLDLDDFTANAKVKVNGITHPLRSHLQFAPLELHQLRRMSAEYDTLAAKPELEAQDEAALKELPNTMCRLVLLAPDDVHKQLQDWQRMSVVAAFFLQPRRPIAGTPSGSAAAAAPSDEGETVAGPDDPSAGARSPHDSLASTGATP